MLPLVTGEFRCVEDPNLRFSPSGVAVGRVRAVASSRKKNDQTGEWFDDKLCWINIVAFKRVAENMAESLQKGDLITATGRLETEDWEDSNGNKRTSITMLVDVVGPALTFNAAALQRAQRQDGGSQQPQRQAQSGGNQDQGQDPWQSPNQDDEPPFSGGFSAGSPTSNELAA